MCRSLAVAATKEPSRESYAISVEGRGFVGDSHKAESEPAVRITIIVDSIDVRLA